MSESNYSEKLEFYHEIDEMNKIKKEDCIRIFENNWRMVYKQSKDPVLSKLFDITTDGIPEDFLKKLIKEEEEEQQKLTNKTLLEPKNESNLLDKSIQSSIKNQDKEASNKNLDDEVFNKSNSQNEKIQVDAKNFSQFFDMLGSFLDNYKAVCELNNNQTNQIDSVIKRIEKVSLSKEANLNDSKSFKSNINNYQNTNKNPNISNYLDNSKFEELTIDTSFIETSSVRKSSFSCPIRRSWRDSQVDLSKNDGMNKSSKQFLISPTPTYINRVNTNRHFTGPMPRHEFYNQQREFINYSKNLNNFYSHPYYSKINKNQMMNYYNQNNFYNNNNNNHGY